MPANMHVLARTERRPRSPPTPRAARARFSVAEAAELSECILGDQDQGATVRSMHKKAAECHVDAAVLCRSQQGSETRRKAGVFLTDRFERSSLRDEWLVASLALLDRVIVAHERRGLVTAPDSAELAAKSREEHVRDFLIEVLAVVIIVLKQSSAEAELDDVSVRDIVFGMVRVSTTEWDREWWPRIRKAEIAIYGALDYRVCVPTPLDLTVCIAIDVCRSVRVAAPATCAWAGLSEVQLPAPRPEHAAPSPLLTVLAGYLVELGFAHAHEAIYMQGAPPAALSLAALYLALYAFGCPPPEAATHALERARKELLDHNEAAAVLPRLASSLLALWTAPPEGSHVASKWRRRMLNLPSATAQLPPCLGSALQTPERKASASALRMELSSCPKVRQSAAKRGQSQSALPDKVLKGPCPLPSPQLSPVPAVTPCAESLCISGSARQTSEAFRARLLRMPRPRRSSILRAAALDKEEIMSELKNEPDKSGPVLGSASSSTSPDVRGSHDFMVDIRKEHDGKLGVNVDCTDGATISILSVGQDGPVHDWNAKNPLKRLQVEDRIVTVNDLTGDVAAMKAECKRSSLLHLVIRRGSLALQASPTEPTRGRAANGTPLSWQLKTRMELRGPDVTLAGMHSCSRGSADNFQRPRRSLRLPDSSAARAAGIAVLENIAAGAVAKRLRAPEGLQGAPALKRIRRHRTPVLD